MSVRDLILGTVGVIGLVGCSTSTGNQVVEIGRETMIDKVKGAWAGKMIGVMYGRPMEFACNDRMYTDSIYWSPENVTGSLLEDDIYGQMCFMSTIDRLGLDAPIDSLAHDFAYAGFDLCHANLQGRKNYLDGYRGAEISTPANNIHCDDIDFQIECDFIGFINPCMPESADSLCQRVGAVMAAGDGLYAGVYLSTLHTLAFNCNNIDSLIVKALDAIPAESGCAQVINDVLECYRSNPEDWTLAWHRLNERWAPYDVCSPYLPFNIDAKLNGGYIVMGLLYGGGDWTKTMNITVGCGQDTDCNTSNAAAVLGIIGGYDAIPDIYKSHIPVIGNELFNHTPYSFNSAVDVTLKLMAQSIGRNGGKVTDDVYRINAQTPVSGEFVAGYNDLKMKEAVPVTDTDRWRFTGNWIDWAYGEGDNDPYKVSNTSGDKLEIEFDGTGISLLGSWNVDGGRARAYIDGQPVKDVDSYYVREAGKWQGNRAYVFFITGLDNRHHTLVLENLDERNQASSGNKLYIERALIYE